MQEPFCSFPALQHLPELTGSLQSTVLPAPCCTRACPDSLQKHRGRAGKKGPMVWGGGQEKAGCWGFGAWLWGLGFFFFEELRCHLVLFSDIAGCWQDDLVARETAGKVHRLLPSSRHQERLPSAREDTPRQGCLLHRHCCAGIAVPAPRQAMVDGGRTSSKPSICSHAAWLSG